MIEGQTLLDLCVQQHGSLESLFEFTVRNGLAVTDEVKPGQVLERLEGRYSTPVFPQVPGLQRAAPVVVTEGQTLVDLCLQSHGRLDSLFAFANLNSLNITDDLKAGQRLQVNPELTLDADKPLVDYLKGLKIRFNTGTIYSSGSSLPETGEGIGFWAIEVDFRVS